MLCPCRLERVREGLSTCAAKNHRFEGTVAGVPDSESCPELQGSELSILQPPAARAGLGLTGT